MLSTILLVYSIVIFVVPLALCIRLGCRRGAFNSALRLGFFLLSGVLAFIIAKLLTNPIGTSLASLLITLAGEDLRVLEAMPAVMQVIATLGGGLLAPIVFMLVFFVIDKLMFFVYVPLRKKFANNETLHTVPHDKLFGAILGGVLALAITISCVLPIGGYPSFLAETTDQIAASSFAEELPDEMTDTLDEIANAPAVKVDYALSGWLFRGLVSDAQSVVSTSFSLLNLFDELQNAKDVESVVVALQELPDESFDLLVSVAKDALTQAPVPEDDRVPYKLITDTLAQALDQLPAMRKKLTSGEYAKEVEALTTLSTTLLSDPSSLTDAEFIKTALSSSVLTTVILDNKDTLTEGLSTITSELSKKEMENIKDTITEYADEVEVDDETVSSVLSVFGIS